MEPLEFYKDNVYSEYLISVFIKSDGNIDKNFEAEKVLNFSNKVLNMGFKKNSGILFWYCKEKTYDEIDSGYYMVSLSSEIYKYYSDENKTYNNIFINIQQEKIEEDINEIIDNF